MDLSHLHYHLQNACESAPSRVPRLSVYLRAPANDFYERRDGNVIAAIYARKSTEQNGVADEQKSVTRQIEHATAYAVRKGWTVDEAAVFVDDGISGAEFANRPGFVRLMNSLKPRPSFQALVISEESRLGREQIETGYALKQLVT